MHNYKPRQFVSSTVWKALFNKVADSLERSTENEDECTLHYCVCMCVHDVQVESMCADLSFRRTILHRHDPRAGAHHQHLRLGARYGACFSCTVDNIYPFDTHYKQCSGHGPAELRRLRGRYHLRHPQRRLLRACPFRLSLSAVGCGAHNSNDSLTHMCICT